MKSAVAISLRLQIPKIVIGMTVVSFATSAPELIVSAKAAFQGFSDLSLGNVMGSNIANLGLVLGITLLVGRIDIQRSFYSLNWPVMMSATFLLALFVFDDQVIQHYEGIILFVALLLFLVYMLKFQKQAVADEMPEDDEALPDYQIVLYLLIGSVGLWGGSELLIEGATQAAKEFGVSERLIGITVVSIGTSIPELSASLVAVMKKEKAISIGNLIGSNVFNILAVLGITAFFKEINMDDAAIFSSDYCWMMAITFLVGLLIYIFSKQYISRKEGLFLMLIYLLYMYTTLA